LISEESAHGAYVQFLSRQHCTHSIRRETRGKKSRVITALQGTIELQRDIDPFYLQIDQAVIEDVVG
jgi:hypothetical protein